MKKIIICIVALMLSAPAAAGWKENFLGEISALMRDVDKVMKAQGIDDANSQLVFTNGVFGAMSGMCVGFSGESGTPVPKNAINEILRVHKMILQGKEPKTKKLHNIGKLCLDYMESTLRKQGIGDKEIELAGNAMVNIMVPRLRAAIGLPSNQ